MSDSPFRVPPWMEREAQRRKAVRAHYAALFTEVAAIHFRHDPVGINFEDNTDEYDAEVGTILPRLGKCRSAEDVSLVVHQEFCRWFAESAGPIDRYQPAAQEIWQLGSAI